MNNQKNNLILLEDLGRIYPFEKSKQKRRYGIYKCHCGNEFKAMTENVRNGSTKSCGCILRKHNLSTHRLYTAWNDMIRRCTNPNSKAYKNYGGRGIKVCQEWLDIHNFINDMDSIFENGLTLDRIDSNGNYEKDNCRWATRETQNRNKRTLMTTNTSGYKGVSWSKITKKWVSKIMVDYKNKHLGYFDTPLEAAQAYDNYVIINKLEHTLNFNRENK